MLRHEDDGILAQSNVFDIERMGDVFTVYVNNRSALNSNWLDKKELRFLGL